MLADLGRFGALAVALSATVKRPKSREEVLSHATTVSLRSLVEKLLDSGVKVELKTERKRRKISPFEPSHSTFYEVVVGDKRLRFQPNTRAMIVRGHLKRIFGISFYQGTQWSPTSRS
jgi:hypothetical protein